MHIVKQEKFEGPLDLLLEMIQKQKLSINEVSLAKVTDEFVSIAEGLAKEGRIDQEGIAQFLIIAGELLLIKSRSLLPGLAEAPEEGISIDELERRLALLKIMRERARELADIGKRKKYIFSREPYAGMSSVFYPPPRLAVTDLAQMLTKIYEALPKIEKLAEDQIKRIISLEEKIKELQSMLSAKVERAFSELVKGGKGKIEVIVSFLALLELAKQRLVELQQDAAFGEIRVKGV